MLLSRKAVRPHLEYSTQYWSLLNKELKCSGSILAKIHPTGTWTRPTASR